MKIAGIMRRLGYISEKNLIDVAVEIYKKEDTATARSEKDFYFKAGNANAIGYLCGRFGIDITAIIKEMNEWIKT